MITFDLQFLVPKIKCPVFFYGLEVDSQILKRLQIHDTFQFISKCVSAPVKLLQC